MLRLPSHDADEVTFDDLKNEPGKSKNGYARIQFRGEQAGKDGYNIFGRTHAAHRNATLQTIPYKVEYIYGPKWTGHISSP